MDPGIDDPPVESNAAPVMPEEPVYYKMTLVVREDLGMSPGKIAAQCCHACMGLFKLLLADRDVALNAWERDGETKVVLTVPDLDSFNALQDVAEQHEVAVFVVQDAGRTEVAAGSVTVLGVFGVVSEVDRVTGGLQLLR